MDLVRPYVAGVLVWLAGVTAWGFLLAIAGLAGNLSHEGWRLLLLDVPLFFILLATSTVAGRMHRSPERYDPVRHATATLAIPALVVSASVLTGIGEIGVLGLLVGAAIEALGALAGWRIAALRTP
ncbi:MAG: hypothetical protein ACRDPK_20180 [Carbonactinosporaceae bacterium]